MICCQEAVLHTVRYISLFLFQLRVRDLEGALEVEKSANDEANKAIDRLTKQVRELEHGYEEERKSAKELMTKLDKYAVIISM